jgi:hypothetical protein
MTDGVNKMSNEYDEWDKRRTIADCLRTLGLNVMADAATLLTTSSEIINKFLTIIKKEAQIAKRHDVLEQLYFAGLVYG